MNVMGCMYLVNIGETLCGCRFGGLLAVSKKAEKVPTCHILDCRLDHPGVVYFSVALMIHKSDFKGVKDSFMNQQKVPKCVTYCTFSYRMVFFLTYNVCIVIFLPGALRPIGKHGPPPPHPLGQGGIPLALCLWCRSHHLVMCLYRRVSLRVGLYLSILETMAGRLSVLNDETF